MSAKGKGINYSDEELDALSEITLDDVESAKVSWNKYCPEEYRLLLDSESIDE